MSIQFVTQDCDICGKPVTSSGEGNFFIAQRHGACALVHLQEQPMTVKELHTFTDEEIALTERSLRAASESLTFMADSLRRTSPEIAKELYREAMEMGSLLLKIQASR